jgi:hypothetical protein
MSNRMPYLFTGAKPLTVPVKTTDSFTLPRPRSISPTDFDDTIRGRPPFGTSRPFHPTPRPYPGNLHHPHEEEDDSDRMGPPKVDKITQSEEKSTRNIGTMHEPVATRNFGNGVQPQSSSTQTSFALPQQEKPPKPCFTYIERPDPVPTTFYEPYPTKRIPPQHLSREDAYYDQDYSEHRTTTPSPPPRQTVDYCYDGRYNRHHSSPSPNRRRTSPLHVSYRVFTPVVQDRPPISTYRPRTSPSQRRTHTPTPPRQSRGPSPHRRPQSAVSHHRRQMFSQETDTSLDTMKRQQHAGVQSDPRSTRETGTTPSIRIKKQPIRHRPPDTSAYSPQRHPSIQRYEYSSPTRDRSNKDYYVEPLTTDDYVDHYQEEEEEEEEEEDETPSMHDQSTMAELLISFDHYTQCDSQPFMADRYIQTTPILDEDEQERNLYDPEEEDIRQLSHRHSTIIPQPVVIQPDTLPRIHRSQYSPPRPQRDGLDYTGNILEVSLHHGQQQRTTSTRTSPVLNIGSENIIYQLPTTEYTVPFETRYSYESNHNGSIRMPFTNSSRSHMFEKESFDNSPVRQSRSNGNFYLSTAPSRSGNSSFRLNITADES